MSTKSGDRNQRKLRKSLYKAILVLETPAECESFFQDLCTPAELEALVDRWEVVQLVDKGVPYRQIQQTTSVSTATITRVARALVHGAGGYRRIIDRIQNRIREPKGRHDRIRAGQNKAKHNII